MGLRFNPFTGNFDFDGGAPGPPGPGTVYSDDLPASLGVAAAGVAAEASRSDHVHEMPSAADVGAPASDPTGITGADAITNIVSLTQAEYDAVSPKSATTLYVITD